MSVSTTPPRPLRVLVVDDDERLRDALCELVRELGHEANGAGNADAAFATHCASPYSILIVDWVLPGLDGLGLVKRLRALPPSIQPIAPYILMVTGRDRPEDVDQALDSGAHDYLTKPIDSFAFYTRFRVAVRAVSDRLHRYRAEQAKARSEATLERYHRDFRQVIETLPQGVVLLDEAGEITYANPAFCEVTGEIPGPLQGKDFFALVDEADRSHARECFDGTETSIEVRLQTAEPTLVELIPAGWIQNGTGNLRLVSIRNITERRRVAQRLALADRLSSLGTLAAGVAHEINNPLSFLMANLEYLDDALRERSPDLEPEEKGEMLDAAAEARIGANRVARIVEDLSRFSRPEAATRRASVNLNAVLRTAIQVTSNQLRHRGEVISDIDELPEIEANESQLLQVFVNVLANAAQALDDHEVPTQHYGAEPGPTVWIRGYAVGAEVVIEIDDNGPGIASELRSRIFDPFFTTKRIGDGTGLGLSLCHTVIEEHRGTIEALDSPRGGARLRIALPNKTPQAVDVPRGPAHASRARVLVIDDEHLVGRAMSRALSSHDVVTTAQGSRGLALLQHQHFDVVFCDLMMPEMSGMDLFEALQHTRPEMAEKVIFMTGGAFTPRARDFVAAIPNPTIEKPFGVQMVRELVEARLQGAPKKHAG